MSIADDVIDAFCEASNMPVLWRMHPDTLRKILGDDRNFAAVSFDLTGRQSKLCGKPVETDPKLNGWQLWVECRGCSLHFYDTKAITATCAVPINYANKCTKCNDSGIVLDKHGQSD